MVRSEEFTREDALKKVHMLDSMATEARQKLVQAMSDARQRGATYEQIASVSGLGFRPTKTLLRKHAEQESQQQP